MEWQGSGNDPTKFQNKFSHKMIYHALEWYPSLPSSLCCSGLPSNSWCILTMAGLVDCLSVIVGAPEAGAEVRGDVLDGIAEDDVIMDCFG